MTSKVDSSTAAETIMAIERQIEAAAVAGDTETLNRLIAEDFNYWHNSGTSDSRERWIARSLSPTEGFVSLTLTNQEAEVHGDVALALAHVDIVGRNGHDRHLNYIRLYRLTPDGWKWVSHRTTTPRGTPGSGT